MIPASEVFFALLFLALLWLGMRDNKRAMNGTGPPTRHQMQSAIIGAVWFPSCALFSLAEQPHHSPFWLVLGVIDAHTLWHLWRRRKKRKPARVTGRVAVRGHRLVVVPAGGRS